MIEGQSRIIIMSNVGYEFDFGHKCSSPEERLLRAA
jgi:hypothetical protein